MGYSGTTPCRNLYTKKTEEEFFALFRMFEGQWASELLQTLQDPLAPLNSPVL
jgi:hypothetical protein